MPRKLLTEKGISALKPAEPGKRYDVMDAVVPGFGIRVTDRGQRTFVLFTRYPGGRNPTRRALGECGAITLATARERARGWLELIHRGIDPSAEADRAAREQQRRRENTVATVVEDYIRLEAIGPDPTKPRQRKGHELARTLRRVIVPLWGARPADSIRRRDVIELIEGVRDLGTEQLLAQHGIHPAERQARGRNGRRGPAPVQARNILAYVKTLFRWAIERDAYGIESSPCADVSARRVVGEKRSADRVLSDDELRALWHVTSLVGYPHGPLYKLLLLSGVRLNEAADARWSEFDLPNGRWTIPAARMKGKNGSARPHVVPLTGEMLEVLGALPRFRRGDYLFSMRYGEKPVWVGDKIKRELDARMLHTLNTMARLGGEEPESVRLLPWTNHDLRRTLRSGLSALRVSTEVAEAVLAHVPAGIRGVYDRHDFLAEKREALEEWAQHLRGVVEGRSGNVVPLRQAEA